MQLENARIQNARILDLVYMIKQNPHKNKTVIVSCTKAIEHNIHESHSRFVGDATRKLIAEELKSTSTTVLKWKNINKVPEDVLKMCNMNNALSSMILQKISSEDR